MIYTWQYQSLNTKDDGNMSIVDYLWFAGQGTEVWIG